MRPYAMVIYALTRHAFAWDVEGVSLINPPRASAPRSEGAATLP